jgi:outer membrane protein assembly factor BamA
VLYALEEANRYSLTYGLGAEIARIGGGTLSLDRPAGATGFSPRVTIGISRLNFLGLGHTATLQTLVSTLEQRALFTYLIPQFESSRNLNLQFSGFFDISKDVRTFSARREEGSVQLGQRLSKASSVQYRFVYRKVNILGTPLVTPELIPLLSQPVRVGLVSSTFIHDTRDDRIDAHRGIYNTIAFVVASKEFGSQTGFVRLIARNATYHRGGSNSCAQHVLRRHIALRGPVGYPTRGTFLLGWFQLASRIPGPAGRPSRPFDGVPDRRGRAVHKHGGDAVPVDRRKYRRRPVQRHGQRVQQHR